MAADVMLLSNELVYGGRLVCGSEAVATAQLQLPLLQQVQGQLPAWLLPALDPARRVLFLDTDALPARDQVGSSSSCTHVLACIHAVLPLQRGPGSAGVLTSVQCSIARQSHVAIMLCLGSHRAQCLPCTPCCTTAADASRYPLHVTHSLPCCHAWWCR